jgi:hypothetical protein
VQPLLVYLLLTAALAATFRRAVSDDDTMLQHALHEGAETGDGAPDDERVHLAGALVGVDGLGVGNEAMR